MKNIAESMPNPAQDRKPNPAQDEDLAALTKAFEKIDADKRAKEREVEEAVQELGRTVDTLHEKRKMESEFDEAFEKIQDKPAIEAEQHVEEAFENLQRPSKEQAAVPAKAEKDADFVGEAQFRKGMQEFLQSRTIDVVLENFRPDMAQAELVDKPFGQVLQKMDLIDTEDLDAMADALNRKSNPAYASLSPEQQATMREMIKPMLGATVGLKRKWREQVVKSVNAKRVMLQDNLEQLEEASVSQAGKSLKEHQESIEKTQRLIGNADSVISLLSE